MFLYGGHPGYVTGNLVKITITETNNYYSGKRISRAKVVSNLKPVNFPRKSFTSMIFNMRFILNQIVNSII